MRDGFAVIPDQECAPTAVFTELEAAISWGLERYGSDAFCIRGVQVTPAESGPRRVASAA